MTTQIPIDLEFRRPERPLGLPGQMFRIWSPRDLILDVKALRETAYRLKYKGPFTLVMAPQWNPVLDSLYNAKNFIQSPLVIRRLGDVILALPGIKQIAISNQLPDWKVLIYDV